MSDDTIPRYQTVFLQLKQQIAEGRFDDAILPGEHALAEMYDVSRVTMRHALEKLSAMGWIERRRGLGTVTKPEARSNDGASARKQFGGLLENLIRMGLKTPVKVLEHEIVRDQQAAQMLSLEPKSETLKVVRVRYWEKRPFSCITTHVPMRIAALLKRKDLEKAPMLTLIEKGGVKVSHAHQSISAKLADPQTAARLEVEPGSALLVVRRMVFDDDNRPIQLLSGNYVPEFYEYRMALSRGAGEDAQIWLPSDAAKSAKIK